MNPLSDIGIPLLDGFNLHSSSESALFRSKDGKLDLKTANSKEFYHGMNFFRHLRNVKRGFRITKEPGVPRLTIYTVKRLSKWLVSARSHGAKYNRLSRMTDIDVISQLCVKALWSECPMPLWFMEKFCPGGSSYLWWTFNRIYSLVRYRFFDDTGFSHQLNPDIIELHLVYHAKVAMLVESCAIALCEELVETNSEYFFSVMESILVEFFNKLIDFLYDFAFGIAHITLKTYQDQAWIRFEESPELINLLVGCSSIIMEDIYTGICDDSEYMFLVLEFFMQSRPA
ncbi:hypothetical protein NADFUDRAFT_52162 [Nadsonia fulvescens var. elongata DSM 6958]|uniref:Uncharacterized protein n=1 Tax=Nadsonia fulvescens var. elongata DSM 6958 TaxID=857566 RepID=A0A1E3PGJ1_9ASCO|nr:hypothetical protein NADFUDRAFT_52162 [Nadsonia fulvescens var. elongata DSM 6958]